MDGKSESRADEDGETMSINTSDGTYRGQSGVTFNQSTSITNGTTAAQVLTQDTIQESGIKTQRQDGGSSSNPLALTIAEVSGNIGTTMNNTPTVDGNSSQSNTESTTNIAGQSVVNVLQQDYLSGSSSGQYVSTSEQHNDSSGALGVDDMEPDDKDRDDSSEILREQDRFLPIANVARIMKKSVPKTGKIAKDAKECVQECVSEFISFITSEASERCHQEKRKTINGEDILFAMTTLGFDQYGDPLKLYLQKYRESMKGEKGAMGSVSEGEIGDDGQSITHYSSAPMHPSMIPPDQASTLYSQSYQPQMQQSLHFQAM